MSGGSGARIAHASRSTSSCDPASARSRSSRRSTRRRRSASRTSAWNAAVARPCICPLVPPRLAPRTRRCRASRRSISRRGRYAGCNPLSANWRRSSPEASRRRSTSATQSYAAAQSTPPRRRSRARCRPTSVRASATAAASRPMTCDRPVPDFPLSTTMRLSGSSVSSTSDSSASVVSLKASSADHRSRFARDRTPKRRSAATSRLISSVFGGWLSRSAWLTSTWSNSSGHTCSSLSAPFSRIGRTGRRALSAARSSWLSQSVGVERGTSPGPISSRTTFVRRSVSASCRSNSSPGNSPRTSRKIWYSAKPFAWRRRSRFWATLSRTRR